MQRTAKLILVILGLNFLFFNGVYFYSYSGASITDLKTQNFGDYLTKENSADATKSKANVLSSMSNLDLENERQRLLQSIAKLQNEEEKLKTEFQMAFEEKNPFTLLGAYSPVTAEYFNASGIGEPLYDAPLYELYHDADYCYNVDTYNLENPFNMFRRSIFFTDIVRVEPRDKVIDKIGKVTMQGFNWFSPKSLAKKRTYHLDKMITHFFTYRASFHFHHEIGKDFLCATQDFNRIPGHEAMCRKDIVVDSFKALADKFSDPQKCVPKMFPTSYRLYDESECKAFFRIITSAKYKKSLEKEPLQYLIKKGHDSHKSEGVYLLDDQETARFLNEFKNGKICDSYTGSLIAQKYVSNPLLLDMNNKFDFRVYMLVASTNPMMAFYHDGLLRVALSTYDKASKERGTHLTNTHLAVKKFEEAKIHKVNGMDAEQLKDYHLWSVQDLQDYLLESKKITDENWLDNHLRPSFYKACIHVLRAHKRYFWKGSNVYQLFGLDFMLDDQLNLWYIESNANPQLAQDTPWASNLLNTLLTDLFDITHALYKSRMDRVRKVIYNMQQEVGKLNNFDEPKWKALYADAVKNKFDEKYPISANNTWIQFMDENRPGADAYFGHVAPECLLDE